MYKFLLYIVHPYSIPIGKPLQEEIERQGHEVFWFSEREYTKKYLSENEKILHTIAEVIAYEPHIVLTATDTVADFFLELKYKFFMVFRLIKDR